MKNSNQSLKEARLICKECNINLIHVNRIAEALDNAFGEGQQSVEDWKVFDMVRENLKGNV